jgi:hypothetical protein
MKKFITSGKTIWRIPLAAIAANRRAKVLIVALSLGTVLATSNFVQTAKAQNPNAAREQALRDCNRMDMAERHEASEFGKTGGNKFVYKACMANHGQTE